MTEIIEQEAHINDEDIAEQLQTLQKAMIDYGHKKNCVNHLFLHEATNRLKESGFWFNELVNNRTGL
jgi:hypothetical protein